MIVAIFKRIYSILLGSFENVYSNRDLAKINISSDR